MLEYSWPGNVRELENAVERAMILSQEPRIEAHCLPSEFLGERSPWRREVWGEDLSIKKASRVMERELIRRALKKTKGNRSRAAKLLEISHPALLSKMKEYEIQEEKY
jgi:two-component system response regulator AtoC